MHSLLEPTADAYAKDDDTYFSTIRKAVGAAYQRRQMDGFFDAISRMDARMGELGLEGLASIATGRASALESIADGLLAGSIRADIDKALVDAKSRNGVAARGTRLLIYWSALADDRYQ